MTPDKWREYPLGAFMTRLTRKNAELNENVLTIINITNGFIRAWERLYRHALAYLK